ncbi:MAG: hypothetical protein RLZZ316_2393 [Bacteroidota bacterium]
MAAVFLCYQLLQNKQQPLRRTLQQLVLYAAMPFNKPAIFFLINLK